MTTVLTIAGTPKLRLPNNQWLKGRNALNTADVELLRLDSNNKPQFGVGVSPRVRIAEVVADGNSGTITFDNIPASYRDLELVLLGRSTALLAYTSAKIRLNGDTGSNFGRQDIFNQDYTTVDASRDSAGNAVSLGSFPAANAPANLPGIVLMRVPFYARTTFTKVWWQEHVENDDFDMGEFYLSITGGVWDSTAAITRIDLMLNSGNWVSGSVATLYGLP